MRELGSYFQSDHMTALVLGILLYFFVSGRKKGPREKRLLALTVTMLALVIFPVTAAVLKRYQTGFYTYPWLWSLVPGTLCIAWGGTELLWDVCAQRRRDGKAGLRLAGGMAVLAALLLLMGNMGNIRGLTEEEKSRQGACRQVVAYLEEIPGVEDELLWAPRSVLEEARRQSGEIRLLYGRNMWEPEAAAYAYDTYPEQQQRLFDWMEAAERGGGAEIPPGLSTFLTNLRVYPAGDAGERDWTAADTHMLWLAAQSGARIWVFPKEAGGRVAAACTVLYENYGLKAYNLGEAGGYTVWRCE